ncbi:M48 family metallopeptidase [Cellulosilyticum sp. I15G10I2]|uniref:M48 family metallopeptidase n=1 Tax=Cellulosilyticum sp. I15G10I2 TaxID=1892843 RepID=UPI00085C8DF4|nr:YgjP-like metallopeptidase domain-containing protein [Cellulosilyticum sp. I15G10I2]
MKLSFEYKGTTINYNLMYKKTAAISININAQGQVSVTAPLGTSVETVRDKVKGNAPWIINELDEQHCKKNKNSLLDRYTYLGKTYKVEVIENKKTNKVTVKLVKGKFVIETYTDDQKELREALFIWYKDKVTAKIKERIKIYNKWFEHLPVEIITNNDKSILLQIKNNKLYVSLVVGMLPINIIDYVLVSILCNLNYPEKHKENIKKLKEILPKYQEDKEWLDKNKAHLVL